MQWTHRIGMDMRRFAKLRRVGQIGGLLLLAWTSASQAECPVDLIPKYTVMGLYLDNDVFVQTDRDYTHGMGLTFSTDMKEKLRHSDCETGPAKVFSRIAQKLDSEFWRQGSPSSVRYQKILWFRQWIYTPGDPEQQGVVASDRPYAGLLMGGYSWKRFAFVPEDGVQVVDTRTLGLGIMGPASFAHTLHVMSHHLSDSEKFRGWRNQVRTEPALLIAAERAWRYRPRLQQHSNSSAEWIPSLGLKLGNAETSGHLGLETRWVLNLSQDPRHASSADEIRRPNPAQGVRVGSDWVTIMDIFLGGEIKGIVRDFSLDGNLMGDSHRAKRRPWMGKLHFGVRLKTHVLQREIRWTVMRVLTTRQFTTQESPHGFVTVAIDIPI